MDAQNQVNKITAEFLLRLDFDIPTSDKGTAVDEKNISKTVNYVKKELNSVTKDFVCGLFEKCPAGTDFLTAKTYLSMDVSDASGIGIKQIDENKSYLGQLERLVQEVALNEEFLASSSEEDVIDITKAKGDYVPSEEEEESLSEDDEETCE